MNPNEEDVYDGSVIAPPCTKDKDVEDDNVPPVSDSVSVVKELLEAP